MFQNAFENRVTLICVSEFRPSLVEIMSCRLFGTKPSAEPKLACCQLEPTGQISVKIWIKINTFSYKKINFEISLAKWRPFCLSQPECVNVNACDSSVQHEIIIDSTSPKSINTIRCSFVALSSCSGTSSTNAFQMFLHIIQKYNSCTSYMYELPSKYFGIS